MLAAGLAPLTTRLTVCAVRIATLVLPIPVKVMLLPPGEMLRVLALPDVDEQAASRQA
ncbi:hypothetical protein D9M71_820400 [compost metagenome]